MGGYRQSGVTPGSDGVIKLTKLSCGIGLEYFLPFQGFTSRDLGKLEWVWRTSTRIVSGEMRLQRI